MKTLKIIGIAVAVIVVILLAGQFYFNYKIDSLIRQKVNETLGADYTFAYGDSHINLFSNHVLIKEVSVLKKGSESENWLVRLDSIAFDGFRWLGFLQSNHYGIDAIRLYGPYIRIDHFSKSEKDSTQKQNKSNRDMEVIIGEITAENGSFSYDPDGPEVLECKFHFDLNEIDYKGEIADLRSVWSTSDVVLHDMKYQFADSIYVLAADSLTMHPSDNTMNLSNLSMESNLGKIEFGRYFGWRKSRWWADIELLKIARPANFTDSLGVISDIWAEEVYTGFDKDLRLPWPDRVTKMPQPAIAGLGINLQVDTVHISRAKLVINTIHEEGREAEITFDKITAALSGAQNIDREKPCFVFNAQAKLMDRADVDFNVKYTYAEKAPFTVDATVGNTNLSFMDEFLRKSAGIVVEEGQLNKLVLHMEGNQHGEGGYVDFFYTNLKISAVDRETGEKKWFLNLLTDLARGLLFWKQNTADGTFRRGEFYLERDVRKAFPGQWIDGLFQGILKTVSKVNPAKVRENTNLGE